MNLQSNSSINHPPATAGQPRQYHIRYPEYISGFINSSCHVPLLTLPYLLNDLVRIEYIETPFLACADEVIAGGVLSAVERYIYE